MDPTLVPGTRFESQFQICVYEHVILRIYIIIIPTKPALKSRFRRSESKRRFWFVLSSPILVSRFELFVLNA